MGDPQVICSLRVILVVEVVRQAYGNTMRRRCAGLSLDGKSDQICSVPVGLTT